MSNQGPSHGKSTSDNSGHSMDYNSLDIYPLSNSTILGKGEHLLNDELLLSETSSAEDQLRLEDLFQIQ